MTCPSCGHANEEAAKACNLCGKLLITKAAPPAAPVPATAVAAPAPTAALDAAAERIPSWRSVISGWLNVSNASREGAITSSSIRVSVSLSCRPEALQPRTRSGANRRTVFMVGVSL
jgi:hypothetical protein